MLAGYTFGAGDLHGPGANAGMTTPLLMIQASPTDVVLRLVARRPRAAEALLSRARRDAAIASKRSMNTTAWRNDRRVADADVATRPRGVGRRGDVTAHAAHRARVRAAGVGDAARRAAWMRNVALVTTLHGQHYTGYMFNDYAKMLETLRWMATQIPARARARVHLGVGRPLLLGLSDLPRERSHGRRGRIHEARRAKAQKMGFKIMPMFGMNSANKKLPMWPTIADALTHKIDGDEYNLNWVDWNNDRHQDGWLGYMNLGVDSWRNHLEGRIADMIERYKVDAYFLDIAGGHVNSTNGDMHEGTKRLVMNLRAKYPSVLGVGEMPYDALHGFLPVYHAGGGARWRKYSRFFSHLSAPAPGAGSSGVHESGFGRFNTETLGLSPNAIPTLQVVDDTFSEASRRDGRGDRAGEAAGGNPIARASMHEAPLRRPPAITPWTAATRQWRPTLVSLPGRSPSVLLRSCDSDRHRAQGTAARS